MKKSEDLSTKDWKQAQSAVFKEYEDFIKRVQENAGGDVPVLTYKKGAFFGLGLDYKF